MLVRQLEALPNVQIMRGRNLTELTQDADGVDLVFSTEGGEGAITVRARFVVGADGARSTVRELLDIAQTDLGFSYEWLVVDVVPHEARIWDPYVVQHCDPCAADDLGSTVVRDARRWEFMRLARGDD